MSALLGERSAVSEEIEDAEPPFAVPDLVLEDGLVIRGRIVDSAGRPVGGAAARIFYSRGGLQTYGDLVATSDGEGRVAFHPLPARDDWSLRLTVTHASYPETETRLSPTELLAGRPFEVVLPAGMELRGRIVDADGAPLAGVQVTVAEKQSGAPRAAYHLRAVTADDGSFSLAGVPAEGAVPLLYPGLDRPISFFTAQRRLPVALEMVSGRNGRIVELGTIRIDPSGEIRGLVLGPDGAPCAGATVSAGLGMMGVGTVSVPSGPDGRFVIADVPPGTYEVLAQRTFSGHGLLIGRVRGVRPGGPDVLVEVKGGRAVILRFHAPGDRSRPVGVAGFSIGFSVHPPPPPSPDGVILSAGGAASLGSHKKALWRQVKEPGTYRVSVTPRGFAKVDVGIVEVLPDEDVEVFVPCREE